MADTPWSLRNIYLYLVCLITLIMVIVGAALAVRSIAEFVYPDPGYFYAEPVVKSPDAPKGLTEEERAEQERLQKAQSTRQAVLGLAGNLAMVFIAGPIYLYHWRKIETEKGSAPAPQPTPAA